MAQGPHIYAIYKYEKAIPEQIVAALYATGFVSGGISASFAGGLADRFGRKRACLLYCAIYALGCLTMLSDKLSVLFVGRFAGGIGTTLLFSVFEAWMVTDYHERNVQASGLTLGSVFGTMTTLSGVVAIASGVAGELLVEASGTRTWPFMAAVLCCLGAAALMSLTWVCVPRRASAARAFVSSDVSAQRENLGTPPSEQAAKGLTAALAAVVGDAHIVTLSLVTCAFEGTMYLFVFFWSAALKSGRLSPDAPDDLPYGIIFSSFMCAMMAGSSLFAHLDGGTARHGAASMLLSVLLIASCCSGLAATLRDERLLFWAFCLLEGCIGVYFPAMACLKSKLVEDTSRGRVYSILRLPLNVFVVAAHSMDVEGEAALQPGRAGGRVC